MEKWPTTTNPKSFGAVVTHRNCYPRLLVFSLCLSGLFLAQERSFAKEIYRLIVPVGGECWASGSYHMIRWNPEEAGQSPSLQAHLSSNGGKTWREIPRGTISASDGTLRWRVPESPSRQCVIRITNPSTGVVITNRQPFQIVASQAIDNYQWINVTLEAKYAARDGAGALTFKNKMFLLGGWHPGNKKDFPLICNNEVWSSTDGKQWDLVKPNTFRDRQFDPTSDWEGRHTAGYVVYRDKMWLVGGDANQGHYQPDIWNSSDGVRWTWVNKETPAPWGMRALHHTLVFKDKIWVLGGQTMPALASSEEAFYRDIWTTTDGVKWTQVQPKKPYWSARGIIGGSVVFKGRMWILGGGTYDTPTTKYRNYYNDIWSSADGITWKQHTSSAPWPPRQYHHVTVYDGRMWVLGGYNAGDHADVWYSSDGVNWYRQFGTPWPPRHAASVFVHDHSLWIAAGSNLGRDVWRLQRSADPNYRTPVEPEVLAVAAVQLDGLADKRGHIYDKNNPNGLPRPFGIFNGKSTLVPLYSSEFGLNYLDDQGRNVYADMRIAKDGNIEFVKWREGGDDNVILINNEILPRSITIKKKGVAAQ
jgi:hypothetical protein